ncbi:MAG: energy-coupling factor transporter ATPase [Acholeplasmatales bacterium]|nr:energy-coupling factor transporter ATPase [Acholeplasmatales bacterium]
MGIKFEKVTHSFKNPDGRGMFIAIEDIDLTIDEKSEFVAVCGHTGSGKSTLIQHMNALLFPSKGNLEIFDRVIKPKKNRKLNQIRKRVGLVFQFPEYQLFDETVLKDVMFGPLNFGLKKEEAKEKAIQALKMVDFEEKLYDQSPFRLSGGQMKKASIAGILALEPDIIILDEPTRGLDPKSSLEVMELFNDIHKKYDKTIVIITHDMDIVSKYAKRVVVLDEGKKVFDGKKEDLFIDPNFKTFHLDYPSSMKLAIDLKNKLNLDIKENVLTFEELMEELERI